MLHAQDEYRLLPAGKGKDQGATTKCDLSALEQVSYNRMGSPKAILLEQTLCAYARQTTLNALMCRTCKKMGLREEGKPQKKHELYRQHLSLS